MNAPSHPSAPTPGPIAVCMHGFAPVAADGTRLHDADAETWNDVFSQVERLGFTAVEIADSHIRPSELTASRRAELKSIATSHGVELVSVHVQRQSVIQPGKGEENLAYAHRAIDAAAELGMSVFSTGLHQPFSDAQRAALWFWTAPGPVDPDDADTRALAVRRLRELGEHAASVGLPMSLEMYEDTYLGTADSAVRLIEEIGLDNVGLNPDIGNLVRLHRPIEDWREMHEKTLPYANYWHMKNYARDESADGSWQTSTPTSMELGLINYRAMVARALELGFRGPFLMEQYGGDSLGVCARNRDYLTSLLPATAGA
ncbi:MULTISPECIES: sugar phosphate isomerase/epimerase family protein [Microbacterium]|jgi:sugar phosphate isomerase/epimerase|uniref:sugar phosphate isomerase/epimerase family protein n=1 Tax=Microbacterium TaxID=33882 RepID=UPI000E76E55E|nr:MULTISPECIES: sugar phosphate isomerase/epimerase family protein [Microbacterium]MDF2579081.1 xylose isomerase [Microbacterium sp.]RKE64489.1 sugar phosphate isomerase/epimerase [Microbacterium sp. AG238]WJM15910.1 sugar phosphate isomerase/epimerase family protein [Microbacterium arborescens]